jgi:alginate O-acetyltransferase complex protein AlgI
MLFNSLLFLVFFAAVAVLYWILPGKHRWILLILASFFFYGVFVPAHMVVLIISVLMNYWFGLWIGKTENDRKRKHLLVWGIILNIGILGIFKYANEISSGFDFNFEKIILPLGISFFTFTNLSYLIEVKRRKWEAERHLGYFTVFVTFFPKLIQGPIERPQAFMPQVKEPRVFDYDRAVAGLRLLLWGFFKKLVVADRLAIAVNAVYDHPGEHSGFSIVMATVFYAFQIYFDFSGYIDIARGAGRILGFDLSKNFNLPYLSKSVKDFWTRWHITLSNWLRDYVFLPLAYSLSRHMKRDRYLGIRTENIIYSVSITVTFVLCGIWHGVGWTFMLWGALYAVYLVIGHLSEKPKKRFYKKIGLYNIKWLYNTLQVVVTFILVTFAWSLFRSKSLPDAGDMIAGMVTGWGDIIQHPASGIQHLTFQGFSFIDLVLVLLAIPFVELVQYQVSEKNLAVRFRALPVCIRWGVYYGILLAIFVFGKFDSQTFIYFQF